MPHLFFCCMLNGDFAGVAPQKIRGGGGYPELKVQWNLGIRDTQKLGLPKTVVNCEVVLFLRSISMH